MACLASFLIAVAVVMAFVFYQRSFRATRTGLDALVEASASLRTRPIRARLSADFHYTKYSAIRPAEWTARKELMPVLRASLAIQTAAARNPTTAQRHVLGLTYLLVADADRARLQLERVLREETRLSSIPGAIRASRNPELLSDLAAAYHTLLIRSGLQQWRAFAVEAVQRAWTLKRTPQIAFTRAVVLESLNVRESAIAAWNDYLALDAHSPWSVEAKTSVQDLRQPTEAERWPADKTQILNVRRDRTALHALVNRHRQAVRLWCEDELLPQWGDAVLRGDSAATAMLATIGGIAEALRDCNGERDVIDAVDAIRRADSNARVRLARGHAAYGRGRKAIIAVEAQNALRETEVAVANLDASVTPFARRALIEHAASVYLTNDYSRTLDELASVPIDSASNATVGRVEWVRGITRGQMGAPELAVGHYRHALDAYRRAGENDYECMIHSLLAWALENSGTYAEADAHRERALEILEQTGNSDRSHVVVFEAAYAAIARDTPALAEVMLDSVVASDTASRNPFYACNSLMWRGAYRFRRGWRRAAADDLLLAKRYCNSIEDPQARARATANLGLARATVYPGQTTASELRDLDAAVAYFKEQKIARWLRTAYVARARALWAAGSPDAAERDFLAALGEARTIRRQIDARDARVSFTATVDDITDAYVDFLIRRGREREAFELADRSRSRELVDSPVARWADDHRISVTSRVQEELPNDVGVIEYRVIDNDTIAAWVLRGGSLTTTMLRAPMSDIVSLVHRASGDETETELRAAGAALYDALLRPIAAPIESARRLVIVPDDDLEMVPFPALYDSVRRQFIVERQATVIAPSAGLHLAAAARFLDRSGGEDDVVIIEAASGGPDADELPDTRREVRAVAAMFPRAHILNDRDALRTATSATLLHFGGHGVRESDTAIRALRVGGRDTTQVAPSQIAQLSLPVTRLVYLSACETDAGPVLRSEGGVTAARAFFAAGVPVVIATVWPVDDAIASDVARRFYGNLRAGVSPAEALRLAQIALLSHPSPARPDWAAFRVIGGGIETLRPTK